MSDLSVPTSKTDAPSANGVQTPGSCNPPTTDAHDPGGRGPHRVEPIAPNQLTPYSGNARTHSKRQIEQIAATSAVWLRQSRPDQRRRTDRCRTWAGGSGQAAWTCCRANVAAVAPLSG